MKKKITFIITMLFSLTIINPIHATNLQSATSFDYSFTESQEWKELSLEAKLKSVQLPNDVLAKATTEELTGIVMNFPFLGDLLAFNTTRDGFLNILGKYNGLRELITRSDLGLVLTNVYSKYPVVMDVKSESDSVSIWKLNLLEIIIAQPEIAQSFTKSESSVIIASAKDKKSLKLESKIYSGFVDTFENSINEVVNNFTGVNLYALLATYVYTPHGTAVSVFNNAGIIDFNAREIAVMNAYITGAYPRAQRLANPSKKYNCHSFAWYSSTYTNNYWMNYPTVYMTDGSYLNSGGMAAMVGQKVYYPNGDHSAYITYVLQTNVVVRSKWGQYGVYSHFALESPYGGPVQFWNLT